MEEPVEEDPSKLFDDVHATFDRNYKWLNIHIPVEVWTEDQWETWSIKILGIETLGESPADLIVALKEAFVGYMYMLLKHGSVEQDLKPLFPNLIK